MAQGDQPNPAPPDQLMQAVLAAISGSLGRRGFFTTEWWTTVIGGALSTVLALVHIKAATATHVVAIAAPALLAAVYAIVRTMHKSALASALGDLFPQTGQPGGASPSPAQPTQGQSVSAPAVGPVAQTDPNFVFEGIPPIEQSP